MTDEQKFEQGGRFMELPDQVRAALLALADLKFTKTVTPKPYSGAPDVVASTTQIMHAVCSEWKVPLHELQTPSRAADHSICRFMAYHILRGNGATTGDIGEFFNRHHSTVLYGCDQHADLMFSNSQYLRAYERVIDRLKMAAAKVVAEAERELVTS